MIEQSEPSYKGRVTLAVINAAIDAGRIEGSELGAVPLDDALDGICDGLA